jgi:hypothetical protein
MSDNYEQATLTPSVKLTDDLRGGLAATCASFEEEGDGLTYVYWEDGPIDIDNTWADVDPEVLERWSGHDLADILRAVLAENSDIGLLTMEGASTCSKLRPGEFGGYALYVTRKQYAWVHTGQVHLEDGTLVSRNTITDWPAATS